MMDAVSGTIFDGVHAENTSSSRYNLFKRLFYRFILNQVKEFLPNPFRRGCPRPIGCIQRYHAVGGANGTTMVVTFVGGCVGDRRNSPTIPTLEYLRGGSFLFPPKPL
jgi:hypothetical protein